MPASTMAEYELSNKADDDLNEIYIFSRQRFGKAKADAYLLALEERFSILARQPRLGRRIDHIRPGYLRYEHVSHSIFYRRPRTASSSCGCCTGAWLSSSTSYDSRPPK
jgi:toxin ParE1/3/4